MTKKLPAVPWPVWCILLAASLASAVGVASTRVLEDDPHAAESLIMPVLGGIVPVFSWLAAGVAMGILLVQRGRRRQILEQLPYGWGSRTMSALGWILLLYVIGVALVFLVWTASDVSRHIMESALLPRNGAVVFGLVFAPGITAALPAVLMTSSTSDEGNYPPGEVGPQSELLNP